MYVYVVMSNDFPDCVFADAEAASKYCDEKTEAQRSGVSGTWSPRIYYRVYKFEVR